MSIEYSSTSIQQNTELIEKIITNLPALTHMLDSYVSGVEYKHNLCNVSTIIIGNISIPCTDIWIQTLRMVYINHNNYKIEYQGVSMKPDKITKIPPVEKQLRDGIRSAFKWYISVYGDKFNPNIIELNEYIQETLGSQFKVRWVRRK